ncbi:MAG: transcription elongation factor Spt5 [Nitrososphaerales archaeon]|nr:transcription elongation factor Spt5 [Nitrososphaerales archaeon]
MSSKENQPKIFAVKTTGGQERIVANFIATRVLLKEKRVHSIVVLDSLKGYVLLEADNIQVVNEVISGFKHVKSPVPGIIQFSDIERFLITKPIISELEIGDIVEVVAGPFKGMRAKIDRIEEAKSEVTVILLDAPYQLPVTIDANYLKIVQKVSKV